MRLVFTTFEKSRRLLQAQNANEANTLSERDLCYQRRLTIPSTKA